MSKEKKKNKKAIITTIIGGTACLLTSSCTIGCSNEVKEEKPEVEENNKSTGSGKKTINKKPVDSKKDLSQLLNNWNPAAIVTNGARFNDGQKIDALKQQLPANIDKKQVEITINQNGTSATIKPIQGSSMYKGNPFTKTFSLNERRDLSTLLNNWNPAAIVTNGARFNDGQKIDALKQQLPANIDKKQVEITINQNGTSATIKPIKNSKIYQGSIEINYEINQALSLIIFFGADRIFLKDVNYHISQPRSLFGYDFPYTLAIKQALKKQYPKLRMDKIKVKLITHAWYYFWWSETNCILSSTDKEVYTGEITIIPSLNTIPLNI